MKRKQQWLWLVVILMLAMLDYSGVLDMLLADAAPGADPVSTSQTVYVTRVIDGDTVEIPGDRVRLYGVDAPESGQAWGKQATTCLQNMVALQPVDVLPKGRDRYDRLLAVLVTANFEVNQHLVAQGCAWAYPSTGDDYRDEEASARAQGLGLWALPDPTPPWEWRKTH